MKRRIAAAGLVLAAALAIAGTAAAAKPQAHSGRVLHELVAVRAGLHGQADPGRPPQPHRLRLRVLDADRLCAERRLVRLPGSDVDGADSVDGVADDPPNLNQHLFGNFNQLAS